MSRNVASNSSVTDHVNGAPGESIPAHCDAHVPNQSDSMLHPQKAFERKGQGGLFCNAVLILNNKVAGTILFCHSDMWLRSYLIIATL